MHTAGAEVLPNDRTKGRDLAARPLLFRCLEVIFYIFSFEQFEVAAHPCEKRITPACCAVVCLSRVPVYVLFVVVAEFQLIPQQVLVALVWLFFDIERDEEKSFAGTILLNPRIPYFPPPCNAPIPPVDIFPGIE